MNITLADKQISIGNRFRVHGERTIEAAIDARFGNAIDATVVRSRDGRMIRTDIAVQGGCGLLLRDRGTEQHSDRDGLNMTASI